MHCGTGLPLRQGDARKSAAGVPFPPLSCSDSASDTPMPPRDGPANDSPKKSKTPSPSPLEFCRKLNGPSFSAVSLPEPSPRRAQAGLARKRHFLVTIAIVARAAPSLQNRQPSKPPKCASFSLQPHEMAVRHACHDDDVLCKHLEISRYGRVQFHRENAE